MNFNFGTIMSFFSYYYCPPRPLARRLKVLIHESVYRDVTCLV